MSVQSEIDRIRKNVGDTLSIIGGKGVVIPEGAGSNELPALVGALGPQLPALTNPGTAADLAQGKELINGSGEKVVGECKEALDGETLSLNATLAATNYTIRKNGPIIYIDTKVGSDMILRKGSIGETRALSSVFGSCVQSDVAEGKTFTSTAGVRVAGTGRVLQYGWKEDPLMKLDTKQSGTDLLLRLSVDTAKLTDFVNKGDPYLTFTDKAGTSFAIPFSADYGRATVAHISNGTVFKPLMIEVNASGVVAFVDEGHETATNFIPSGEIALSHGYFTPPSA